MAQSAKRAGPPLCDIGINLLDSMFQGIYNEKSRHPADLDVVMERAASIGMTSMIVTAADLKDARSALALARSWNAKGALPRLYTTVGVHPTSTSQLEGSHQRRHSVGAEQIVASLGGGDSCAASADASTSAPAAAVPAPAAEAEADGFAWPTDRDSYVQALFTVLLEDRAAQAATPGSSPTVVAIGECGLDYDRLQFASKEVQLRHFDLHIDLAEEFKLPLFLHNRNTGGAEGDFCQLMRKHRHRFSHGVVHSFTGTEEEMRALVDLGLHVGINGCSLKTAENCAVAAAVPLDKLMLETDAPWCGIRPTHASHAHLKTTASLWKSCKKEKYERGSIVKDRNEPCTIIQVAEVVAALKGMSMDELIAAVYENTRKVFFPWEPEHKA